MFDPSSVSSGAALSVLDETLDGLGLNLSTCAQKHRGFKRIQHRERLELKEYQRVEILTVQANTKVHAWRETVLEALIAFIVVANVLAGSHLGSRGEQGAYRLKAAQQAVGMTNRYDRTIYQPARKVDNTITGRQYL